MLKVASPFPQVGSYALAEIDGETLLARIIGLSGRQSDATAEATISLPARRYIASGNVTLPLADLIDGTPLTPEEEAELKALEATVPAGPSRSAKVKKQQARYAALRLRSINSVTLANLMAAAQRQRAA